MDAPMIATFKINKERRETKKYYRISNFGKSLRLHCTQKQAKSANLKMTNFTNREVNFTNCEAETSIIRESIYEMKPTIGQRLRELRTAKNLNQEQLAKIIGVSYNTISSYESDMRQPSYDVLESLSRVFRVSTDYQLGIDDRRIIIADDLTEPEIEAVNTLVSLMAEKNKLINGN